MIGFQVITEVILTDGAICPTPIDAQIEHPQVAKQECRCRRQNGSS